ncbi:MAG: GNAT family N-acetyltransferase [Anaerolineales bacterium]|nr:MAG: GNAT family N-acetyltransferase [Anaerolineales bacterium]
MMKIRDYEARDLERVLDITIAAWQPIFASFRKLLGEKVFSTVYPDWQAEKHRQLSEQCAGKYGATVRVAELNGKVVGFIIYYCNASTGIGEISHNAVDPDYQHQGIATLMYPAVLAEMKAQGMRCAQVSTGGDPSHAPARRAYEKAGFDRALPSVNYYQEL